MKYTSSKTCYVKKGRITAYKLAKITEEVYIVMWMEPKSVHNHKPADVYYLGNAIKTTE